jgi:hypothetical protein
MPVHEARRDTVDRKRRRSVLLRPAADTMAWGTTRRCAHDDPDPVDQVGMRGLGPGFSAIEQRRPHRAFQR